MFEHVVDDDGVGRWSGLTPEEIMDDIHAVLLAEAGQAAGWLVASIPVRVVLHDVAEFSAAAADLDHLGSRLQVQMDQAPDLMMTAAKTPIELRYVAVIRRIETCGRGVDEAAIGALCELVGLSPAARVLRNRVPVSRTAERTKVARDRARRRPSEASAGNELSHLLLNIISPKFSS